VTHIVLIPGFAGFDALGQLEYYAGVTPLFQHRRGRVLHYFDNFPTAAVVTRAMRLQRYLAKRVARGEIAAGDEVTLVGHSTGGLDIRRLIWDLHARKQPIVVDGGASVEPEAILDSLRRVVFLSVPHWGTNIADWVRGYPTWRELLVAELRTAVSGAQVPGLDRIETWVAGGAACLIGAGLLYAVRDALSEADEHCGKPGPGRTADAHEAAAALALYLRQMASDFSAIDDLASSPAAQTAGSPAHFNRRDREKELELWEDRHIEVRSYVTRGPRPFRFDSGSPAPLWELAKPWTWPEIAKDEALSAGTDIVYRTSYRACAGGPFVAPPWRGNTTRYLGSGPQSELEVWDNDGIVNTASMRWPSGQNVLVPADHLDIVGHYHLVEAAPGSGRRYQAYDLLGSAAGFDDEVFRAVWTEIFDGFAVPDLTAAAPAPPSRV